MRLFVDGVVIGDCILSYTISGSSGVSSDFWGPCDSVGPEDTCEHDDEWGSEKRRMIRFEWSAERVVEQIDVNRDENGHRD